MSREASGGRRLPKLVWIVGAGALLIGSGIAYLLSDPNPAEPRYRNAPASLSKTEPQAMVPWRDPASDTSAFFPGAVPPPTDAPQVLSLSRRRREIQDALGPETPLAGNALYLYPVTKNAAPQGVVVLHRARGEWGAIEVVVALRSDNRIAGVRIQRHREPPNVARYLNSPGFLNAFRGKKHDQAFRVGVDLPQAPAEAQTSTRAVAQAVRAVCIAYHAGTQP